ncbi:MAG: bifunctional 4-hydroxy-2-oxoglutarate aldolase/2-dehydro-3-deoxy-phosphogluconate aldolase, partial [Alphaproteobacteria bacterium]|nr:bifunctional 4-hydroxy-2-oxoglutarate aldolase/2-dehydro-3-deoxy-phosphogluconate aldolase [Alphaproteobacteria bacterium]
MLREMLRRALFVPVLTVEDAGPVAELTQALAEGGLKVVEFTLRTPAALAAIEAAASVKGVTVGAGTVLRELDFVRAADRGASFFVSPGFSQDLAQAARGRAWLPGVQTPSEVMAARSAGFKELKFFPSEFAGGPGWLKAIHAVFPELLFCPTGSIAEGRIKDYLAAPNVACVGGAWVAPAELIAKRDFKAI